MDAALEIARVFGLGRAWAATVLLLSLRLGAVFLMAPVLAPSMVPARVRVLLVLGLSIVLAAGLPQVASSSRLFSFDHVGAMILAGLTELALGATLGLGILVAFSAFTVAGRLLDVQIGFGLGQVFDPVFSTRTPILTAAYNQVAVLVFFLMNGHHALLRALAFSLERFPLGQPWPMEAAAGAVLKQVGGLFTLSLALAAPAVFAILIVDLALGVLARNLPQINMLTFGIPVKLVMGLLALALWMPGMGPSMSRVYASITRTWEGFFIAAEPASPAGAR